VRSVAMTHLSVDWKDRLSSTALTVLVPASLSSRARSVFRRPPSVETRYHATGPASDAIVDSWDIGRRNGRRPALRLVIPRRAICNLGGARTAQSSSARRDRRQGGPP